MSTRAESREKENLWDSHRERVLDKRENQQNEEESSGRERSWESKESKKVRYRWAKKHGYGYRCRYGKRHFSENENMGVAGYSKKIIYI